MPLKTPVKFQFNLDEKLFRLLELDALRGIAALCVLLFHYTYNQPGLNPRATFSVEIARVDLFFMISGFVTCLSLKSNPSPNNYLRNRFSRLYPAYWISVLMTGLVMHLVDAGAFNFRRLLGNLTMVQTLLGFEGLDGSYWTLLTELLFYGWVLAVSLLGRTREMVSFGFLTLFCLLLFHALKEY